MPTVEELAAQIDGVQTIPENDAPSPAPSDEKQSFEIPSFLRAKTGEGDISKYREHPLCFDKSEGLAQIIRGFTGMFQELDLAVIDIVVGFWRWRKGAAAGA